jgi:hypothetical protein
VIGIFDELDGNRAAVDGPGLPKEELIANRAATEFCIPQDELVEFIAQRNPFISERDVLSFARRVDVHPGLVVGQIHSRTGRYDFLRRYLVKIRQFILPEAITDGWGTCFRPDLCPDQWRSGHEQRPVIYRAAAAGRLCDSATEFAASQRCPADATRGHRAGA